MLLKQPLLLSVCVLAACMATESHSSPASTPATNNASPSAVANAANWPRAASPAAMTDSKTETAIDALLASMSVEQKVGQLIQADIGSISPADFAKYPLGSLLAGGNSGPYGDERASAQKWQRLVDEFRAVSRKTGAGIPIIFGVDAVHGHSNLPGATIFPHNIGLGAANDPALIRKIGAATAAEIAGSGIEWTFAPTLAVPEDLRWGRSYEGYGSDPALIATYGREMVLGLQGDLKPGLPLGPKLVAATAKHFLADGGTADGRDQGDARMSEADLISRHAAGYPAAINAGALTVMASFSSWNGVKHHGNKSLLTDVLKDRMGFGGLVVGDWNGHGQVDGCTVTSCAASINAGVDLFMAPDSWKALFENTIKDVREGRISKTRLDDAVRRNLRVKYKLGLMGDQSITRNDPTAVGAAAHLALAREAVAKSLVLLKNNHETLPIKPGARVLVTGPGANNMAMQTGGWTITWQGTDTTAADFPNGQTIGAAIASSVREAGGKAAISSKETAPSELGNVPDVAIVVLGEAPYAEFQGDVAHLAFIPRNNEEALIARLRAQGTKVVVLFLSGRPMFTSALINQADAFVAGWLPGTQGQGVADVLVARKDGSTARDFTGRLSFAWPADARSPVTSPLFPVGYGLDYRRAGPQGQLNEDPKMDLSLLSKNTTFIRRGTVPAPWFYAADGLVVNRPIDLAAQEDARKFSWTGTGKLAIEGFQVDLTREAAEGAALTLDWRIDARPTGVAEIIMGEGRLDLSTLMANAPLGTVIETQIPLRCFAAAGTKLETVGAPLRLVASQGFGVTIRSAGIEPTKGQITCPAAIK